MSYSKREKRITFRPSVIEASLEDRLVLSGGSGVTQSANPAVMVLIPSAIYAEQNLTPPPGVSTGQRRAWPGPGLHPLTLARLRADYARQIRAARKDLKLRSRPISPSSRPTARPPRRSRWPTSRPAWRVP